MKEQKGSSPSSPNNRENPAACIIVAREINLSPSCLMGREALYRPENENALRGLPEARAPENRCAPVLVVD